jgi:predicted permease
VQPARPGAAGWDTLAAAMSEILAVTIPFFALVLCGYLAARYRLLPESAIPGLNGFVLYFALPCMLFRFGAGMPVGELLDPVVLGVYALTQLAVVTFTIAVTLSERVRIKDTAFGALVAAFPNSGFMGMSLLAERYRADNGRVTRIIVASTVLAFFSLTLLMWLLGARTTG